MPTATARGKEFNFPDGTTPEQMAQAIDEYFAAQQPSAPALSPEQVSAQTNVRQVTPDIYQGLAPDVIQRIEEQARTGRGQQYSPQRAKQLADFERFRLQDPYTAEIIENLNPLEGLAIGFQTGLRRVARGVGLGDAANVAAEQLAERYGPGTVDIGVIAGEAAPFVPFGLGASQISRTGARVAATTGLGAAEGGIVTRGSGGDLNEAITGAGFGGAVAGALELGIPIVGRLGGKLIRRVLGRAPTRAPVNAAGEYSDELRQAIDRSGLDINDFNADVINQIDDRLNPQQQLRKQFLEQELGPGNVSRAQVTRGASDFQVQQEAAKTSTRVRDLLERQEQILTTRFNTAVESTGGRAVTETSPVVDSIVNKAIALDDQITGLYRIARENASGEKVVRFDNLVAKLRELASSDRAAGGAFKSIMGDLRTRGAVTKNKITGRVAVDVAEEIRKGINDLYDPNNGFRNVKLRELKQALDDDVFSAVGNDVFQQARQAKAAYEQELNRAKISKFDSRRANVVRDILENKINPDRFVDQVVLSKNWRAPDLQQIKDYVDESSFNDLRAEVLQNIRNKAFIGPEDAQGFQSLSRDKLENVLKGIGDKKLAVLFTREERQFLDRMLRVAKFREPVRMTQQGRGPSAQGIGQSIAWLERKLRELPLMSALVNVINLDTAGRVAISAKPQALPEVGSALATTTALGTSAAAANEVQQ